MSIRNASEPVTRLSSLNLFLAIESPPILSAPVRVGARISRIVQHAQRRPGSQRAENDRVTDAKPRRTEKPFFPKHFHHLACRADARKRFEEVGDRFPDLCVGVEHGVAGRVVDEACGQGASILPTSHLVEDSAPQYDPDDFDEETCPRCNGSGQTGLVGDECKLCKGNGFVTEAKAITYRNTYQ
jgi:hypothetical protein